MPTNKTLYTFALFLFVFLTHFLKICVMWHVRFVMCINKDMIDWLYVQHNQLIANIARSLGTQSLHGSTYKKELTIHLK